MEEHSSIEVTDLCVDFRTEASGFQYLKELITVQGNWCETKIPSHPRSRLQDQIRLDHRHRGTEGCGKSTLPSRVASIYPPSEGQVTVRGRVALLAGLGVGFQGDLTGRENLRLGGIVAGLERAAISAIEADVIEFSGIEAEFIDRPLRTYSSGMRARLGFSLASHMAPDILLIDEVFAVRDPAFRSRSRRGSSRWCGATRPWSWSPTAWDWSRTSATERFAWLQVRSGWTPVTPARRLRCIATWCEVNQMLRRWLATALRSAYTADQHPTTKARCRIDSAACGYQIHAGSVSKEIQDGLRWDT